MPGILLAECPAVDLKVPVIKIAAAVEATETANVVLPRCFIFHVLPFDAPTAAAAKTAVELVVVQLAVGLVVEHVELGRGEWLRARSADEAGLVVLARQATIGR